MHQLLSPSNLGMLGCSGARSLRDNLSADPSVDKPCCNVCDSGLNGKNQEQTFIDHGPYEKQCLKIIRKAITLCDEHHVQRSTMLRISLMLSMKRIYSHVLDPELLLLSQSEIGQWCLKSLHSSIRELRLVSG